MRFALDSNILVYAFDRGDRRKHDAAVALVMRAMKLDCVLPAQVVAEFLNVIRRKHRGYFDEARNQANRWIKAFTIVDTSADHVVSGAELASRHNLQLWDAIIWQVATSARSTAFLTEDMQDGFEANGMRAIDPFKVDNAPILDGLLADEEEE